MTNARDLPVQATAMAGSLDELLWRIGLYWKAPRTPQQSRGMADTVVMAASPCS